MSAFAERLGWPPKQTERSFWVLGSAREAFEAAAPVIEGVAERYPRLVIILTGPEPLREWLGRRFPTCVVHAQPMERAKVARRFIKRANFRAAAALEDFAAPPVLLDAVRHEGLTLVALRARDGAPGPRPAVAAVAEAEIAVGPGQPAAPGRLELEPAVALLGEYLARDIKVRRAKAKKSNSAPAMLLRAIERPGGRRLLDRRLQRIADLDALRERLGDPRTILCLGNGPSSEGPAVASAEHDALFRVNHSWLDRGFLARPDVVFTGGTKSMATVDGAIFGVQSEGAERRLVGARFLTLKRGATRFFRVPTLSPNLTTYDWGPVRPTNGAAMLAVAISLSPERLVVAGIDMFRHPDGAYPGDAKTPNAFAPAHDADAELSFLLDLFASYRGELVIVGEILREAWERRVAEAVDDPRP